ncbi:MAG: hypothetical protein AAF823_04580 [Planctomycetota bacterium]
MTQAPTTELPPAGFEPPSNTQFNVFLENRVGKMLDLIDAFADQPVVMAGYSVVDSNDHAVVRVVTSNAVLAARLLRRHGLAFSDVRVLVVELDAEHTLRDLCYTLLRAELSIHYVYPLLVRPRGLPALVLHTDDRTFAEQLLRRKLFTLLGENDLGENAARTDPEQRDKPASIADIEPTPASAGQPERPEDQDEDDDPGLELGDDPLGVGPLDSGDTNLGGLELPPFDPEDEDDPEPGSPRNN